MYYKFEGDIMKYSIGIDIGGTNIVSGIVDQKHNIVIKEKIKTNAPRSAESICQDIDKMCRNMCTNAEIPLKEIEHIGIACPGIIKSGVVEFASNLQFKNVPLKNIIEELTGIPCHVCNDANAAAYAEYVINFENKYHSLVTVTIGTGIGGGIIINDSIIDGFNGAGAEIGHMIINPAGRVCTCGNRGCFEAYCSATALINDTKEAMFNNPDSKLWTICPSIDEVDGKTAYDAAELGDEIANKIVNKFIKYLSIGVSNIITLLQPEVVLIGGGMSSQKNKLIEPLLTLVNDTGIIKSLAKKTKISTATLLNDAGIVGAAAYKG